MKTNNTGGWTLCKHCGQLRAEHIAVDSSEGAHIRILLCPTRVFAERKAERKAS